MFSGLPCGIISYCAFVSFVYTFTPCVSLHWAAAWTPRPACLQVGVRLAHRLVGCGACLALDGRQLSMVWMGCHAFRIPLLPSGRD
jgi:hypothetical protein